MSETKKSDLIVVTGAGGFIAGALVRYFKEIWNTTEQRWR